MVNEDASEQSIQSRSRGVKSSLAENVLYSPELSDASQATSADKEDVAVACTEKQRLETAPRRCRSVEKGTGSLWLLRTRSLLTVFYATTALGAISSSFSTDMGTKGVLDRLPQTKPMFALLDDLTVHDGNIVDL